MVESDTPPSSYAVKVLNEKDLPFGFEYFRSMLKEESKAVYIQTHMYPNLNGINRAMR